MRIVRAVSRRSRRGRMAFLERLMRPLPKPVKVLDVGGLQSFWVEAGLAGDPILYITLLNLTEQSVSYSNLASVVGDARDLSQYADGQFDVAFSNSVIEHVGGFLDQAQMAREFQRVARRYYLQTPNYSFPIEPHYMFPFFQFLPLSLRGLLLQHMNLGWYKRVCNREEALARAARPRLLRKSELLRLFPTARFHNETWLGLTKSFVLYGGWD